MQQSANTDVLSGYPGLIPVEAEYSAFVSNNLSAAMIRSTDYVIFSTVLQSFDVPLDKAIRAALSRGTTSTEIAPIITNRQIAKIFRPLRNSMWAQQSYQLSRRRGHNTTRIFACIADIDDKPLLVIMQKTQNPLSR